MFAGEEQQKRKEILKIWREIEDALYIYYKKYEIGYKLFGIGRKHTANYLLVHPSYSTFLIISEMHPKVTPLKSEIKKHWYNKEMIYQ